MPAPAESPALDSRFIREELPGVAQGLVDDGRYVDAIDLLERAVVIAAAPDSAARPTACDLYEALARLHDHAGDHDRGLEATLAKFRVACDLPDVTMEEREQAFRDCEERLARQGDPLRARTACDLFLAACRREAAAGDEPRPHLVARALVQVASLCVAVGLLDDAARSLDEFDELVAAAAAAPDQADLRGLIVLFGNRANLLRTRIAAERGDFQTARRRAIENLEFTKGEGGIDDRAIVDALLLLAEICRTGRDFDRSVAALVEAATLIRGRAEHRRPGQLGDDEVYTADELSALERINQQTGQTLLESGDPRTASSFFMRALEYSRRRVGKHVAVELNILLGVGRCRMAEGDWQESFDAFDIARRPFHDAMVRAAYSLGSGEQAGLIAKIAAVVGDAVTIATAMPADADRAVWAAEWLLNFKGIAAAAQVRQQRRARTAATTDRESLYRLGVIRQQLSALANGGIGPAGRDLAAAVTTLEQEEARLLRTLAFDGTYAGGWQTWHTLDEVRAALPRDAAFIDIVRTPNRRPGADEPVAGRYLACVVPAAGGGDVLLVELGAAEPIDRLVAAYRRAIAAVAAPTGFARGHFTLEAELRNIARPLAEAVLEPILAVLAKPGGEPAEIVVSPDGPLWLVPWQALPLGDDDESPYAIERYQIRTVTSGRDLLPPTATAAGAKARGTVILADPAFGPLPRGAARDGDSRTVRGFPPLPGARQEAEVAAARLADVGGRLVRFQGPDASETNVKQRVAGPRILVIATHGFFEPDQAADPSDITAAGSRSVAIRGSDGRLLANPLLRCGLALAGANRAAEALPGAGADDGILTGAEIVGLDLGGTDLVVLSACDTGVGVGNTGEGVAGLRQAFQIAGATSVVATLWTVPDLESAQIMAAFYANVAKGQPASQALREAQLAFIKARRADRNYESAHPYHWAAYGVTGR